MPRGNPRGNPQNLKPFKKGQSGNPGGKPKALIALREVCREMAPDMLSRIRQIAETAEPRVALEAARELLDRGFGKPVVGDTDPVAGQVTTVRFIHVEKPIARD